MKTIAYISASFAILPAVVGMFKYRSATKTFRVICIYFFICLLTELISIPLSINKINNALLGDIFYIIEGLLLIGFYYLSYREKEFLGPAILIAVAYFLYGLYSTIIDPGPWIYNANFRAGESLMVQMLSAYSLIRISKEEDIIQPLNHDSGILDFNRFLYLFFCQYFSFYYWNGFIWRQ